MSTPYPILRSLDPYHQRLGYVNGVLLCAVRGLDSREAITARFYDMMFDRVYESDPRWVLLSLDADPDALKEVQKSAAQKPSAELDARDVLMRGSVSEKWLFVHDLWRVSKRIYSKKGGLTSEADKVMRPVELAKWLSLLLPTYELSEEGLILARYLRLAEEAEGEQFNPLIVRGRLQLQVLYLRALLKAECLFPHLVHLLAGDAKFSTRGQDGLLRAGVGDLLAVIGSPERPDQILETQRLLEFEETIRASGSTEENYLRPRMEILVDLGLLDRISDGKGKAFPWITTDALKRAANEWRSLRDKTETIEHYLDERFFASMALIFHGAAAPAVDNEEALSRFMASYRKIGREFGFTPARTVATMACVDAFCEGRTLEIAQLMKLVQEVAHTSAGEHLQFSGGSRFDDEFLIRVDPAAFTPNL